MGQVRVLITVCAFLAFAYSWPAFSAEYIPDRYDEAFEQHASKFLPQWRWEWLKAQCFQESRLRPEAVSPVGAQGLCQFMPGTWRQYEQANQMLGASPWLARHSIRAAAWYMARLRNQWKAKRPESDRRELAQASYNAGLGNILAAQRECNDAAHWPAISECLSSITGRHAQETLGYVEKIKQWYRQLTTFSKDSEGASSPCASW